MIYLVGLKGSLLANDIYPLRSSFKEESTRKEEVVGWATESWELPGMASPQGLWTINGMWRSLLMAHHSLKSPFPRVLHGAKR